MYKPTKKALAEHIGMSQQGLNKMRNQRPRKFNLIWIGWLKFLEELKG